MAAVTLGVPVPLFLYKKNGVITLQCVTAQFLDITRSDN